MTSAVCWAISESNVLAIALWVKTPAAIPETTTIKRARTPHFSSRPATSAHPAPCDRTHQGAHGLRLYDWARIEVRPWHRPDRRHGVLARRSVSRPGEISYHIAYCRAETTLDELIRIAGSRWAILAG